MRKTALSVSISRILQSLLVERVKRVLFVLILSALFVTVFPHQALAFDCDVSVSPSTTTRDTSTTFSFSVMGASLPGSGVVLVKFTRPSGDYTITGGSATGWSPSVNSNDVTFTIGSPTSPAGFTVYATSGSSDAGSANWAVQMSASSDGSSPIVCTGSLGTSISGSSSVTPTPLPTATPVPDTTAPSISNVTVSAVSNSSVTISWETNENASAQISYGTSTSYGSTKTSSDQKTSHSFTLSDLSTNTTYHGQIRSTDGSGNAATSNDFTFATAQSTTTVTVTTTETTYITPTPTATPIPDRTPPRITVSTNLNSVFSTAPLIEGTVTDNKLISKIEYTFDEGKNWSIVDKVEGIGERRASFSFTPFLPGEGDYQIQVRATDDSENIATSPAQSLVLDRLPPEVGGSFLSVGPQILQPNSEGNFTTVVGLNPKLTFGAIGGATSIDLHMNDQVLPMMQNSQTRLWSTLLPLNTVGVYSLQVNAIDGAENKTSKTLGSISVLPNGVVTNANGPINGARVAVYYFDSHYGQFRLWNAQQYGQENPQLTDELGRYKLFLPSGTYYIQFSGPFGQSMKTNIFSLDQNTPIIQNFELKRSTGASFGLLKLPFSALTRNDAMINLNGFAESEQNTSSLVGKPFPDFNLGGVQNTSLTGQSRVVSMMTRWLPQTATQMGIFDELSDIESDQALVILSQESNASTVVFAKQGGYTIPIVADPDGILLKPLQVTNLPTHFFINRRGIITRVSSGVLTKQEIEAGLTESYE